MEDNCARLRHFLAWQYVWKQAQAVSMFTESHTMIAWVNETALELLCEADMPPCEMQASFSEEV